MKKKFVISAAFIVLLAILIPIEHKYDKLFRFYSLTLIPDSLDVSSQYEKKLYFYVSDLIAIILTAIGLIWIKIPIKRFFSNPLWIIFVCAFISIYLSPFSHYPVAYSRLLQLLTPILLYSFISNGFEDKEKNRLTLFLFVAIVSVGLFEAAVGVAQYFNQAPLGLRLLGETNQKSIFLQDDGSRWLIDQLLGISKGREIIRASGTLPHSNVFGGFLVLSLIATYGLYTRTKKAVLLAAIPLLLFALTLSFSRSALLAWGVATVFWFGCLLLKKGLSPLIKLGLTLLVSSVMISALLFPQYISRGGIINSTPLSQSSNYIRQEQQSIGMNVIQNVPLFGLGLGQFSERSSQYIGDYHSNEVKKTAPHNIYIFLTCEIGIIALITFLLFFFKLSIQFLRTSLEIESITFASITIAYLIIGLFDFYPILFQQGKLMLFMSASFLAMHTKVCNSSTNMVKHNPA